MVWFAGVLFLLYFLYLYTTESTTNADFCLSRKGNYIFMIFFLVVHSLPYSGRNSFNTIRYVEIKFLVKMLSFIITQSSVVTEKISKII